MGPSDFGRQFAASLLFFLLIEHITPSIRLADGICWQNPLDFMGLFSELVDKLVDRALDVGRLYRLLAFKASCG